MYILQSLELEFILFVSLRREMLRFAGRGKLHTVWKMRKKQAVYDMIRKTLVKT